MSFDAWVVGFGLSRVLIDLNLMESPWAYSVMAVTRRLLVLETKGKQLQGSADTEFKRKFFNLLEKAYTLGHEAGEIELFAEAPETMRFRILLQEEAWKSDLEGVLAMN
jgi:hypothetical protein